MHCSKDLDTLMEASGEADGTLPFVISTTAEEHASHGFRSAPLTTFVVGDVVAERFEILRFLGQGGMGQVFEAMDRELGISVALKVVRPDLASRDDIVRRFKNEVQLARQVTHPNVCRIYDLVFHRGSALQSWGSQDRLVLIVTMEMLRGETLSQRLRRSGALSPVAALPLLSQLAAALDAAHKVGVVHRDFKSANVILVDSGSDHDQRAVVTDFGLAVPARTARSNPSPSPPPDGDGPAAVSGTPAYVAPELLAGLEPGPAADIYSLGVVLYEMMTGVLPFQAETPEKTALRRVEADPEPPSQHRPELSPAWDAAILRCLSRDPLRRFARAGEVVEAVVAETARPRRKRRIGKARSVAAALALTASLLAFGDRERPARPSVALLGMTEISGASDSEWIATALTEILASELTMGGTQELRLVARKDVEGWRERATTTTARLTAGDLRQAHDQLGADFLVYGHYIARSNGTVQLDVRLWDGAAGRQLASILETGEHDEVAALAERMGEQLRSRLGLGPARHDGTLAEAPSSPSLLAERAEAWANAGEIARAAAEARRAMDLASGLHWAQRLRLEALYCRSVYDWPAARGDRLLLARACDTWAKADLGIDLPEALELFRRAGDRLGEARILMRQAFEGHEEMAVAEEKLRRALRIALELIPDAQQSLGALHELRRTKARVEAVLGDAAEALATVEELVEEARASGAVVLELEDRIVLGEIELDSGDAVAGQAELCHVARRARHLGLHEIADRAQRVASR